MARNAFRISFLLPVLFGAALLAGPASDIPPSGVEQLLPRGRLAANTETQGRTNARVTRLRLPWARLGMPLRGDVPLHANQHNYITRTDVSEKPQMQQSSGYFL